MATIRRNWGVLSLFVAIACPFGAMAQSSDTARVLLPESELATYFAGPTRCTGEHADDAMKTALERFHAWRVAYNTGQTPPNGAFRDAGVSLDYLYNKLGCRDGLVAYRYGNILRLNKKFEQAINVMSEALPAVRQHYTAHLPHLLSSLGQACVPLGRSDEAISYYRQVAELDPKDSGNHLNLANQLIYKNQFDEGRKHIELARAAGLSPFGQKQADKLLAKLAELKAAAK